MGLFSHLFSKAEDDGSVAVVQPLDVVISTEENMVEVVGESHYQDAISAACGTVDGEATRFECFAELVPEPSNAHDPNAVMVRIDRRCVGYLSRDDAQTLGPAIADAIAEQDGAGFCPAVIVGRAGGKTANLGVLLQLEISRS